MSLKSQISNTYASLLKKSIDSKQVHYWEQAIINNAATLDSFSRHILMSEEYNTIAFGTFKKTLNDTLKEHQFDDEHVANMFEIFYKNIKGQEVTPSLCRSYLYRLDMFDKYFRSLIEDVSNFVSNRDPTSEELSKYKQMLLDSEGSMTIPEIVDYVTNNDVISQKTTTVQSKALFYNEDKISEFEDVFQRPMFIQEYFKYIVDQEVAESRPSWEELFETHTYNYNKLRSLFNNFTGKSISEYYYVKKYLFKIDDETFFDNIVDEIVKSKEYVQGVHKVVGEKYERMFDQSLCSSDIDYIFKIIQSKKLDIVSDSIDTILTQFKEETDNIVSCIFEVYMSVLQRAPDMMELEKYTTFYRERKDAFTLSSISTEVEKILVRTLEFHDIVKARIRDIYVENKEKPILNSTLYDILNMIISRIDEITIKNLNDVIHSLI